MSSPSEGSVRGRGEEEMIPERGDPFEAEGAEMGAGDEGASGWASPGLERALDFEPREDHGLGAVDPAVDEEAFEARTAELGPETDELPLPVLAAAPPPGEVRFSTLTSVLPSPAADLPSAPHSAGLGADEALVRLMVPDEKLRSLWDWADDLRSRVYAEIDNLQLARQLLDQIERARNQIMSNRDQYEEAERVLGEVEYRVQHAAKVREWSVTIGNRLLVYEITFALLIVLGMVFLPSFLSQYVLLVLPSFDVMSLNDLTVATTTMLWGGLGGVVGALVALRKHIAQDQDFDRQWWIWYITNPLMGIVLGAFIFLIVRAGLFALLPNSSGEIQSTWLVNALGWLAGFQQNVAYDLVERVVKIFEGREEPGTGAGGEVGP